MVIRQRGDLTQIGVLEDNVLVEHYVARESQTSLIGNVYLGRVQNVLPSMEAAFIDIGKGRNAVLYAGEVNWSALGHKDGQPRKIESVLSSGQSILVQVTKDPIGHKGARLTSQVSLAGRFLVYVPDGTTSGISRKLPDTERNRLKTLLKDIVPDTAGVIVRTAAEGAAEDELTRDVERLKARWEDIEKKAATGRRAAAALRRARPDPQGRPRPVHRGLRQAGHRGRRRLGHRAVVRRARRARPRGAARALRAQKDQDVFAAYRDRRADQEGPRAQGLAALRRLAGHRPDRGDDRRRRQHRQVHRLGRQPRGDRHQEQPRGRRGDRASAPAARHRRHHRRRLHRHGPRVQPRPRAAPPGRVPGPRPHPAPGRRGDLARPGPDDPQADRDRAPGVLLPRLHRSATAAASSSRRRRSSPSSPRRRAVAAAVAGAAARPRTRRPRPRPRSSAPSPKDVAAMARHERAEAEQAQAEQAEDVRRRGGGDRRRRGHRRRGADGDGRRPRAGRDHRVRARSDETEAGRRPGARARGRLRRDAGPSRPRSPSRRRPPSPSRRGSSRAPVAARPAVPAGPPTASRRPRVAEAPRTPAGSGTPEQPEDETPALHVPVKRKGGARKR